MDQVYTTGEKMSKAGLNTLICIVTVFVVLSCDLSGHLRIPYHSDSWKRNSARRKKIPADGAQKAVEQIEKMEEKKDDLDLWQ